MDKIKNFVRKRTTSNRVSSGFVSRLIKNQGFEKLEEDSREHDLSEAKRINEVPEPETTVKKKIKFNKDDKSKTTIVPNHRVSKTNVNINVNLNLLSGGPKKKSQPALQEWEKKRGAITTMMFDKIEDADECKLNEQKYLHTKELELLYSQLLFNTLMQAVLSLSSILSAIFDYEISLVYPTEKFTYLSTSVCFCTSILLWVLIVFEYYLNSRIAAIVSHTPEWIWRKDNDNLGYLFFRIFIILFHPNPFLVDKKVSVKLDAYETSVEYPINHILCLLLLIRFWFLFKLYLVNSKFSKPRTHRIGRINGIYLELGFAFKSIMAEQPYLAYGQMLLIFFIFSSVGIKIFESPIDGLTGSNFSSYWNSCWCILISMLTVGFGDFYPRSVLGRIIAVIAAFFGIFILAILISTVSTIFSLSPNEKRICLLINRIHMFEDKEKVAKKVVIRYLNTMRVMKKCKNDTQNAISNGKKLDPDIINNLVKDNKDSVLVEIYNLKESLFQIKRSYPVFSNNDYIIYHLTLMENALEELEIKYDLIIKKFEKIMNNKINLNTILSNDNHNNIRDNNIDSDNLLNVKKGLNFDSSSSNIDNNNNEKEMMHSIINISIDNNISINKD